jgi:hypothetical protein
MIFKEIEHAMPKFKPDRSNFRRLSLNMFIYCTERKQEPLGMKVKADLELPPPLIPLSLLLEFEPR